jgi:hypothetical protein
MPSVVFEPIISAGERLQTHAEDRADTETGIPPGFRFKNTTLRPHCGYVCFVWISEQIAIISLQFVHSPVFTTEVQCLLRGTSCMFKHISSLFSSVKCLKDVDPQRDQGKAYSQPMAMTGTSLIEGKGNTAYAQKHEIREGKYFIRQKHRHSFVDRIELAVVNRILETKVFSFFFHWHYSPLWALACLTTSFHFFLSITKISPSSHSQHLKVSFYSIFPSFPGSSPSSRPIQLLDEYLFRHPVLLHSLHVT